MVERWIPNANIKRDFLGIIDMIAFHPDKKGVIGVQATDDTSVSKHVDKALRSPMLPLWLKSGDRTYVIQGWRKKDGRLREEWWEGRLPQKPERRKGVEHGL